MTNLTIAFFLKFRFWGGDESEDSERERFAGLKIQRETEPRANYIFTKLLRTSWSFTAVKT